MTGKTAPIRISHIGIQTYDVAGIRDWYCKLMNGYVVFENLPHFCTVTFDDEHHRFAIGGMQGERVARDLKAVGYSHSAFTMASLTDMLLNYERARDLGIKPQLGIHHGPTVSLYYSDPDGNRVEILIDVFESGDEAKAFMRGPVFEKTMGVGSEFEAEDWLQRLKAGATEAELLFYDEEEAVKIDTIAELHRSRQRTSPQPS